MTKLPSILFASTVLLAACGSDADRAADAAEDRMETAAEASAAQAGSAVAALGLTEAQLIDADLVGTNDLDLGSVESVLRGADGQVDRLVGEIENSNPDRLVEVPIAGLTPLTRGNNGIDLSTTMTREQLAALPAATLPQP